MNIPTDSPVQFMLFFGAILGFYGANWEESHTHVMRSAMNIKGIMIGITETQWLMILTLLLNGVTKNRLSEITLGEIYPSTNSTVQNILKSLSLINWFDQRTLSTVEDVRFICLFSFIGSFLGWSGFLCEINTIFRLVKF